MDEYNSDSSGVDSDAENGEQQIATKKRAATFVMNSGFDFDLGAADHKPVHAWSFTKLRAAAGTDGRTSVTDKIARVLDRNAAVKQNLSILAARNPANQKPAESEEDSEAEDQSENEDGEQTDDSDHEDVVEDDEEASSAAASRSAARDSKPSVDRAALTSQTGSIVRDLSTVPTRISGRPDRVVFSALNLSKPLIRACADLGFATATPIQAATIPIALTGSDILANAVTGSGKTAAFMLPILERLLYRPRRVPQTRVVVLTPTRELAAQCHSMTETLGRHTDIRVCLVVGGLSAQQQEAALRQSPDIVVATPGRLIDHLRNSRSVHLEDVEILVLDEADRLLEMGFIDEVREIVRACPKGRQTMLFSATLTDQVNDLARLSLHNPQKISVDAMYTLADHLIQEFIRIRPQREGDREAMVLALCARTFHSRVIVFFRSKQHCHRMAILFGLHKLNCAELHGNLTQTQRLEALEKFRDGTVNFLLCTDLAARGLDIKGVETVINFSFPQQLASYIHRVGRTARAGLTGRSVTLVGEQQRKLLKEVVRRAPAGVKSRVISDAVIAQYKHSIETNEADVNEVVRLEKVEKELRVAEMQANRATNLMVHEKEIMSRPARSWFQTEKERQAAKLAGRDVDSEEEADAKPKKASKSDNDDEEKPQKKQKEDPYRGMSRDQRRRKMAQDAEIKMLAQANAEERAARAAAGEGDSDASDSEPKKVTKPGQPIRVSKKDLAVAKQKVDGMQQKQKLLAKSFKKDQKNADLEIEEQPQKQSKRKAEVEAADEGGDYLDQNELAASVSQLSGAARKKFKQSISEAEASRFASRKKRDPDSFSARYREAGAEQRTAAADGPKKPFRVKGKKAFKSKAKHQRR